MKFLPDTMYARHAETGDWHVLNFDDEAYYWHIPAEQCYAPDHWEGEHCDLANYDFFQGVKP